MIRDYSNNKQLTAALTAHNDSVFEARDRHLFDNFCEFKRHCDWDNYYRACDEALDTFMRLQSTDKSGTSET